MTKYVYYFGEGYKSLKSLLGGKGANLSEMTNLGLPVPEGFTITTEAVRPQSSISYINIFLSIYLTQTSLGRANTLNSATNSKKTKSGQKHFQRKLNHP